MNNDTCEACYKITCRRCKWEPNDEELKQVQKGILTACPVCQWIPGEEV